MARIRTIKPDFFRHEKLFEAERDEGLPLRVAFAGLWTAADRDGRFRWSPRQLKLDCLPYDEVDFSRVLDALVTRGFISRYVVDGKEYGFIPSWREHQIINNREAQSSIPEPVADTILLTAEHRVIDACPTRHDNSQGEGKGREGEGEGTDLLTREATRRVREQAFDIFWGKYPYRDGSNPRAPAEKAFNVALNAGAGVSEIMIGLDRFILREDKNIGTRFIPQASTWLEERRWVGEADAPPTPAASEKLDIDAALKIYCKTSVWSKHAPCGEPGTSTFSAPAEILAKYGLLPDGRKSGELN